MTEFVYFLKVLSSKLEDFGPDSPSTFLAISLLRELANLLRRPNSQSHLQDYSQGQLPGHYKIGGHSASSNAAFLNLLLIHQKSWQIFPIKRLLCQHCPEFIGSSKVHLSNTQ